MTVPRTDGIDIARYQTTIDWPRVHATGVRMIALKATQGTTRVDSMFTTNRSGAASVRWKPLYHFMEYTPGSQHTTKTQAEHYLSTVGKLALHEGAMLDAEIYPPLSLTGTAWIDWLMAEGEQAAIWCETVEAVTHRPCLVYAIKEMWHNKRLNNGKRGLMMAWWPSTLDDAATETAIKKGEPYGGITTWQFSDHGTFPGVPTRVDLDMVLNPAKLDDVCGLSAPVPAPIPAPIPPPLAGQKHPVLRKGMAGSEVRLMQQRLAHHGARIFADGRFGPQTEGVLVSYQRTHRLLPDGVCGSRTWAALLAP